MDEEEWLSCEDPDYAIPFLVDEMRSSDRKLRLFACACCERVAAYVIPDLIPLLCSAERYADGLLTASELLTAHAAARQRFGVWDNNDPHYRPQEAAIEAFILSAEVASNEQGRFIHFAQEASGIAAIAVEHAERQHKTLLDESARQSQLLRDIFGNPFRPVAFNGKWRTSDVELLATGIYDEKAFDRMPILADALQDAGCDSDDILNHFRDPHATHVRGCWALDLVLGKE